MAPPSGSASQACVAVGDLVGVVFHHRCQPALVKRLKGSRADLHVGFDARSCTLPVRELIRIASLSPDQPVATRLDAHPWRITASALEQARPSHRDAGSAWILLIESAESIDLAGFSDLVAAGHAPIQCLACWLWLSGEQTLFRWRQGRVQARPLTEVRRLRQDRRRQALHAASLARWQQRLRERQSLDPEAIEPAWQDDLKRLGAWAAGDTAEPLPADLCRALQGAHCAADPRAIRHLLVDLALWDRHQLPSLVHSQWRQGFPAELEELAMALAAGAAEPHAGDAERVDLCALHTVTVDDDDTLDIDDALSCEPLPEGGCRLWIHVADPDRLVPHGSPLDLEARRRASSLYLARGVLPMFPACLSNGAFSLRAGQRNAAWSLAVRLDQQGEIGEYRLLRSWVRPAYRLSYDDVDALLELAPPQEGWLLELQRQLQLRRQWRLERGALQLEQAEGRIRCRDGEPVLEVSDPSASRQLVAEAMILAGAVIADHGRRHSLALPYRGQVQSPLPSAAELQALPVGPVRHAAIRRCLSRGQLGCSPAPHHTLGLDAYVQATSPIRRYSDLLVQRQLRALAEGSAPFDQAAMASLITELEAPLREAISISRDDQRHWLQEWLQRQHPRQWHGLFLRWLREQDRLALVHLEDLAVDLPCEAPGGSEPGDALLVRVVEVDPLSDRLRLQAVA